MQTFILGYKDTFEDVTVDGRHLTLYPSKEEAAYDSEEWLEIEAETEAEARCKYEEARYDWLFKEATTRYGTTLKNLAD